MEPFNSILLMYFTSSVIYSSSVILPPTFSNSYSIEFETSSYLNVQLSLTFVLVIGVKTLSSKTKNSGILEFQFIVTPYSSLNVDNVVITPF